MPHAPPPLEIVALGGKPEHSMSASNFKAIKRSPCRVLSQSRRMERHKKNVRVFDQKALTELNAVSLRFVSRFQSLCSNRIKANRVSSHISPAGETPEHVCDCWLTVTTTLLVSAITFTVDHE